MANREGFTPLPPHRWSWLVGALVFVTLSAVSLWSYHTLSNLERDQLRARLEAATATLETEFIEMGRTHVQAQRRLARRLEHNPLMEEVHWRDDADMLLGQYDFYRAILVTDAEHGVRWSTGALAEQLRPGEHLPLRARDRQNINQLAAAGQLGWSRPLNDDDNDPSISAHFPLRNGNELWGYAVVITSLPLAIDEVVSRHAAEHLHIQAFSRGRAVYPRIAGTHPAETVSVGSFLLDLGGGDESDALVFRASADARLFAVSSLQLRLALIAGLVVAFLMAAAAMLALGAHGQARILRMANTKLEAEIHDRELAEQELKFLASHDPLTGLPNRVGIMRDMEQMLASAGGHDDIIAVLFLDLDQFKDINDSLGHHLGDELLKQIPGRLEASLGEHDLLGRLGGDEFIVMAQRRNQEQITRLAQRLLAEMDNGFPIESSRFFVTASIGIAIHPAGGHSVPTLIQNADAALFEAKRAGRNRYSIFSPELLGRAHYRLSLSRDIREALDQGQFRLVYQPIVALDTLKLHGVEALLRWRHPDGRDIPPEDFVRVAEETGMIERLSRLALELALKDLATWRARTGTDAWVAVNMSGSQFKLAGFVEYLSVLLHRNRLPPDRVHLELTEEVLMENLDRNRRILEKINAIGVPIAVDDFGVGYSSLAYLKNFPVATVKIDRGFIRNLTQDREDQVITRAIAELTTNLGMRTVAEGIESVEQLELLRAFGCAMGQGYLFSRPVPAEDIERMIRGAESWREELISLSS